MRWLRSLQAQLILWAVLPVTLVIIALAFTGVYAHQREMRDFVAERDLTVARLLALHAEDWVAQGMISGTGEGLEAWLEMERAVLPGTVWIVDGTGRVLVHTDPRKVGAELSAEVGVAAALEQREGAIIVPQGFGMQMLVAFAPIQGTEWVLLVQEPVTEMLGPILQFSSLGPVVAVGAALISLLIFTFGWRTIVRPLQQVAEAAGKVSWGEYAAIAESLGGVEEIRSLQQALMAMVERLQGYEAGMHDYLGAVTQGQESERARLARELHDGPVQVLIALSQRLEMARKLVERGETEAARALLAELRETQVSTIEELRRMIGALRPVYLEDLGFLPALEMLVRSADERGPAQVRLEHGDPARRACLTVELAAYRIAQEALNNARQHAQAQHITVRVQCDDAGVTLAVVDDGVGFVLPERPDVLTQAGHFGLVGLWERVRQVGGTLQIRTAPGAGTEVVAHLPEPPEVQETR